MRNRHYRLQVRWCPSPPAGSRPRVTVEQSHQGAAHHRRNSRQPSFLERAHAFVNSLLTQQAKSAADPSSRRGPHSSVQSKLFLDAANMCKTGSAGLRGEWRERHTPHKAPRGGRCRRRAAVLAALRRARVQDLGRPPQHARGEGELQVRHALQGANAVRPCRQHHTMTIPAAGGEVSVPCTQGVHASHWHCETTPAGCTGCRPVARGHTSSHLAGREAVLVAPAALATKA